MSDPTGWSRNPDGTYGPPIPAVAGTHGHHEFAGELGSAVTIRDLTGVPVKLTDVVFGIRAADVLSTETTTSTSFVDLATSGPEVTVTVGQSGRAIILAGADSSADAGDSAIIGVQVDGGTTFAWTRVTNGSTTAGQYFGASVARAHVFGVAGSFASLTPGSHTFKVKYRRALGTAGAASFTARWIVALPF